MDVSSERLNPKYGGAPSAFCEVGVQEEFGHNLASCCLMWLTGFIGQPLVALGLTCVCFVSRDFLSLEGGLSNKQQFFHSFSKYKLKGTTKIFKEIHAGLKLEWSLYDKH